MQTASFYGSSDDLIEVGGVKGADEFNIIEDGPYIATLNLGGKMRIHCLYDGCWSFAVGQVDERIPLPDWPVRVRQSPEKDYSTLLEVDVPDDVKVFLEKE